MTKPKKPIKTAWKGGIRLKHPHNAKRTVTQRLADLPVIAALALEGLNSVEIARYLNEIRSGYNLTEGMIRYDMVMVRQEWLKSAIDNYDEARAEELARIQHLEREAWEAWRKSWKDQETTQEIEDEEVFQESMELKKRRTAVQKTTGKGNVAYLGVIQWCIDKRIKIYGLDAPRQVEITWRKELEKQGFDPETIIEIMASEMAEKMIDGTGNTNGNKALTG